jgi:preprotein translocase subunit SecG
VPWLTWYVAASARRFHRIGGIEVVLAAISNHLNSLMFVNALVLALMIIARNSKENTGQAAQNAHKDTDNFLVTVYCRTG